MVPVAKLSLSLSRASASQLRGLRVRLDKALDCALDGLGLLMVLVSGLGHGRLMVLAVPALGLCRAILLHTLATFIN